MNRKKRQQLGMNPSTASQRLQRDLLYEYGVVEAQTRCFHCGDFISREDFSIEHITPWLDSDDPVGLYFDLNNITFSHQRCNKGAARRPNHKGITSEDKKRYNAEYYQRNKYKWS